MIMIPELTPACTPMAAPSALPDLSASENVLSQRHRRARRLFRVLFVALGKTKDSDNALTAGRLDVGAGLAKRLAGVRQRISP